MARRIQVWEKNLQNNLGVAADGIIGRGTLEALFVKFKCPSGRAKELALSANVHFRTYGILENADRLCEFIGQLAHESGGFRYMEEIASGAAYEGRRDLGNTQPGDGKRYKGRGPIQLTGRANYRKYGRKLGIDFERWPTMVAKPSIGLWCGLLYWDDHNLNALADNRETKLITKRINGGYNGLQDRINYVAKMRRLVS